MYSIALEKRAAKMTILFSILWCTLLDLINAQILISSLDVPRWTKSSTSLKNSHLRIALLLLLVDLLLWLTLYGMNVLVALLGGEWIPNQFGGRENLEAVEFLRSCNHHVHTQCPGVVTIAEESTAWPLVTRPPYFGGLGFNLKWNMGWMHDTLNYFQKEPVHRKYHQNDLTFAMLYHHHENFILPLSHDEVVHGKGSLLQRMPGDDWQRFANLRALLAYQWFFPGKKLLFMGGEIGQSTEWNANGTVEWWLLTAGPYHAGIQRMMQDLNHLYQAHPGLWEGDFDHEGFYWLDCTDVESSVFSFVRQTKQGNDPLAVVMNLTPVLRANYRLGLPRAGVWKEVFNSDCEIYGGSNQGNLGRVTTEPKPMHGHPQSAPLTLPPVGIVVFQPEQ